MSHYKYLIIGGGMAADSAVRGIRTIDPDDTIGVISAETDPPYNRPPLSKKLWTGKPLESIWRKTDSTNVEFHLGRTVRSIDLKNKSAEDDAGDVRTFDKLLLATGGSPRRLSFGEDRIIYFRTLQDYKRLRELTEEHRRFAVIGGGFIGSEIAAALSTIGKDVVMIFPGAAIGSKVFPPDLALYLNTCYREKGVKVLTNQSVVGLQSDSNGIILQTSDLKDTPVDGVIAGLGIIPNVGIAETAGLMIDNGILVDQFLRASHPDVYAAGDVASFFNTILGKRRRVEHEDNANTMGKVAGQNMAGGSVVYDHLPFFYSDLFDLGYEAVGELDSRMEIVADWKEPFREGVLYYTQNRRVRGVLLWNVWGQVDHARKLIAEPGPFHAEDLKGRLPQ